MQTLWVLEKEEAEKGGRLAMFILIYLIQEYSAKIMAGKKCSLNNLQALTFPGLKMQWVSCF